MAPTRNPWALTEAEAIARDDAILADYMAAMAEAKRRFVRDEQIDQWLHARFGKVPIYAAIIRAANRRILAQLGGAL